MVQLPDMGIDPTIEKIKELCEERTNSEPRRTYIGASGIGHECARKTWYAYNGYDRLPIGWQGCFAIEDGHRTEDLIAERLRMVEGVELHTHKPDGSQYGFNNGYLKGHYDGVIKGILQAPSTWHIWENKAVNEKKFSKLIKLKLDLGEKKALEAWDYIYYVQAVLYMHMEGLTRHYTTVASCGGRDIISVRTNENPKLAEAMIAKAKRIHDAKEPPEKAWSKDFYQCKWCEFREVCHK